MTAHHGDDYLRLDWPALAVGQCEVYWERRDENALQTIARVATEGLRAARSATVRRHTLVDNLEVKRANGALSLVLPQNQNETVALAVYAKMRDRLRFEVRYRKDVPQSVRDRLSPNRSRLASWIVALREDAVRRLPWHRLHDLLQNEPAPPRVAMLLDLFDTVAKIAARDVEMRRTVLEQLLTTGGISVGEGPGMPSADLVGALARAGVVEHVRLVRREAARSGTRYRLSTRYAGLCDIGSSA